MKSLASDNYSSVMPQILEYLSKEVNIGHARAYGNDDFTAQAKEVVKKNLGLPNTDVHFVMTGTAANVMSIRQTLRSIQSILVPKPSHINTNETGAPEAFTQSKVIGVDTIEGKIDLEKAQLVINQELDLVPHAPRPKMVSIAQATEYGTVYSLDELKNLSEFCKRNSLYLHLDLCRVYNAAIYLNTELSEIIDAAKPDIASLGGTKNGLLMAEAVIIINDNLKEDFQLLQKQSMQLYSKMRYLSAQFIPYFEDGLWRQAATQANTMCTYLTEKLKAFPELRITMPVQTNQLFVILPEKVIKPLQDLYPFYVWDLVTNEVRLVTSFDTTKEEIDQFAAKLGELMSS